MTAPTSNSAKKPSWPAPPSAGPPRARGAPPPTVRTAQPSLRSANGPRLNARSGTMSARGVYSSAESSAAARSHETALAKPGLPRDARSCWTNAQARRATEDPAGARGVALPLPRPPRRRRFDLDDRGNHRRRRRFSVVSVRVAMAHGHVRGHRADGAVVPLGRVHAVVDGRRCARVLPSNNRFQATSCVVADTPGGDGLGSHYLGFG